MIRKWLKIFKSVDNEKGSILIISYFVIVLMLGVGAAFMLTSSNEARLAERERLATVAFHIAEAGIERGLYDLRQDFVTAVTTPSWADGNINGYMIGSDTVNYYAIPYSSTAFNDGTYTVQLKNVSGGQDIWLRSVGTIAGVTHTIEAYVKMVDISPWNNAIFAGAGAAGAMVNGNVDIRGSVHILGTGLLPGDYAIEMGGTAQLVGNNYNGVDAALTAKVPALPTVAYNGETVQTLNAVLRVKRGIVGVSGSATVGEPNVASNSTKETVDAVYSNDGFGGNQGNNGVYSDNSTTHAYDLGDSVAFPSLNTPYQGYATYKAWLKANALVISSAADLAQVANITPGSNFSLSNARGTISMSAGNLSISGIVYIDNGGSLNFNKQGVDKNITYSGKGSIYVDGNVGINTNLVTSGNVSFPTNIVGIMTPNTITFNEAQIDVMGIFYAETQVTVEKQTDIMGSIVSNYFDMGTNVPSIFQVPATVNGMPPGMVGSNSVWYLVVAWIKS